MIKRGVTIAGFFAMATGKEMFRDRSKRREKV